MRTTMVEATPEQKTTIRNLLEWLNKPDGNFITLGGFAGTGKTTVIALLRKLIAKLAPKTRVAFCAYTGKASQVLNTTLRVTEIKLPQDSISTIHSLIYAPVADKTGRVIAWRRKNEVAADLIILDEASMVDELIFKDLASFNLPIIAVGDHGQLPPVNGQFNLMAKPRLKLETIHRQARDNPIIKLSIIAREEGQIPVGNYGAGVRKLNRYDSATGQEVEEMLGGFRENQLILVGFNHSRIKLNQTIRGNLDFEGDEPRVGDKLICLKNNWEKGIYNGMVGRLIKAIPIFDDERLHWYEAEITFDEGQIYTGKISAHQFNQPTTLTEFEGLKYRSLGDLFDFGYALTVHKAQGSQAQKVLLFEERNKHMTDDDWRRWLYTGVTRAEEELTIVGV